jgi:triosephosphate isomerase (TIM)
MTPPRRFSPPVLAANWKMHQGPRAAREFMASFLARYTPHDDRTVVIFPPTVSLAASRDALGGRTDVILGVQNVHAAEQGAFTGETSVPMALEAGATVVLVGHSERRHVFGETDEETAAKCAAALKHGALVILCVGEQLSEREAGATMDVVLRQLRVACRDLPAGAPDRLAVAYEPVWAIGTGRTATPEDASEVHREVRAFLEELWPGQGSAVPILYGGSVKPDNARALLAAPGVDGLLVGGASLDPEGWTAIAST